MMQMRPARASCGLILLLVGSALVLSAAPALAVDDRLPTEVEFRRLVEELKNAGEPTTPKDLERPPVPPEQNAVTHLRKAFEFLAPNDEGWQKVFDWSQDRKLSPDDVTLLRRLLSDLPTVEQHLEKAEAALGTDWQIEFARPLLDTKLLFLKNVRELARYLATAAQLRAHEGNHAAVVRHVRQILFVAGTVADAPFLVSHLVMVGVEAIAIRCIEVHGAAVAIGTRPLDAPRDEVTRLVAWLIDESRLRRSLRMVWQAQRVETIDLTILLATRQVQLEAILGPPRDVDARKAHALMKLSDYWVSGKLILNYVAKVQPTVDVEVHAAAKAMIPDRSEWDEHPIDSLLARVLRPPAERLTQQHFLARANRRLAAVVLAARLHAADHDGGVAEKLDALVPKYLPRVPSDPMAAKATLGYIARNDGRYVYSVWRDGEDDGGVDELHLPEGKPDTETDRAFRVGPT